MTALDRKLHDWLGAKRPCACGQTHEVRTRWLVEGPLDQAAGGMISGYSLPRRVLVGMDPNTAAAAGNTVVRTLSAAGCQVVPHVFAQDGKLLAPSEPALDSILKALDNASAQWVLGVGAGTVNDLCKYSASQRGLPYVACPSAPSMNGYTSTIAALKQHGLKVTLSCAPPIGLLLDSRVQDRAPAIMRAAGFADLMSKYVCNADWVLSQLVEGGYYCDVPFHLASAATDEVAAQASAIAQGDPQAVDLLAKALLLSGVAMAAAGSSAPASGGEHLMSHYWEMLLPGCGSGTRYHGTQVGIGILICATLYEHLRKLSPGDINPAAIAAQVTSWELLEASLRDHFGKIAGPVVEQARLKYRTPAQAEQKAAQIKDRWSAIWQRLDGILRTADQVRALLQIVGAPTTVTGLGLTTDDLRRATAFSRYIRGRYTVLDFAADIGRWTPTDQAEILKASATL